MDKSTKVYMRPEAELSFGKGFDFYRKTAMWTRWHIPYTAQYPFFMGLVSNKIDYYLVERVEKTWWSLLSSQSSRDFTFSFLKSSLVLVN